MHWFFFEMDRLWFCPLIAIGPYTSYLTFLNSVCSFVDEIIIVLPTHGDCNNLAFRMSLIHGLLEMETAYKLAVTENYLMIQKVHYITERVVGHILGGLWSSIHTTFCLAVLYPSIAQWVDQKRLTFRIFIDVLCERSFVVKKKFVRAKLKTVKFSLSGTSHTF